MVQPYHVQAHRYETHCDKADCGASPLKIELIDDALGFAAVSLVGLLGLQLGQFLDSDRGTCI